MLLNPYHVKFHFGLFFMPELTEWERTCAAKLTSILLKSDNRGRLYGGLKRDVFRNPRSKSSNERGLSPEHFGTNIKAIGQKLRWSRPKTYHRGGVLGCD